MFTIGYEIAVYQAKGVNEEVSCGLINSIANTLGFTIVCLLTPYLSQSTE